MIEDKQKTNNLKGLFELLNPITLRLEAAILEAEAKRKYLTDLIGLPKPEEFTDLTWSVGIDPGRLYACRDTVIEAELYAEHDGYRMDVYLIIDVRFDGDEIMPRIEWYDVDINAYIEDKLLTYDNCNLDALETRIREMVESKIYL